MTERCGICGKFIRVASWDRTRLCSAHAVLLKDFDELNKAIFDLDQKIARFEKTDFCRPLYRMRCNLGELKEVYKTGRKVNEFATVMEIMGVA